MRLRNSTVLSITSCIGSFTICRLPLVSRIVVSGFSVIVSIRSQLRVNLSPRSLVKTIIRIAPSFFSHIFTLPLLQQFHRQTGISANQYVCLPAGGGHVLPPPDAGGRPRGGFFLCSTLPF